MRREDVPPSVLDFLRELGSHPIMVVGVDVAAGTDASVEVPRPRSLPERVADDLAALLPEDLGPAMPELPGTRDLSAYDVALAAARRSCPHDMVHQPLHGRPEVDCLDCGRHLTATEYYRERQERSR